MDLTNVSCNKCGASLQITDTANFVTCRYCGAQLEIKRTDSTISTEVLNRIDQNTSHMAEDLSAIRRESEIERLDREWALRREGLVSQGKGGQRSTPSIVGGLLMIFIGGGFGVVWTIAALEGAKFESQHFGGPSFMASAFPCIGVLFIIGAIVGGIVTMMKAGTYQQEEADYQRKRATLLENENRILPRNPELSRRE